MNIVNLPCNNCGGVGIIHTWITAESTDECGHHFAKYIEEKCPDCKGKCYTEYAMFTAEEAKQIMKVCNICVDCSEEERKKK